MKNLTSFQQKLVDDLINEFEKVNPKKETTSGTKRFTLNTISECISEESRVIDAMSKVNKSMMKLFATQFDEDLKEFKKEFGKVFDVQLGTTIYSNDRHDKEKWLEGNQKMPSSDYNEMYLFIVSKTKLYTSDSRWNECNGKSYIKLYVDFKREYSSHKLETNKEIRLCKIVGLQYRTHDYLNKERSKIYSTLDELIQNEKYVQQRMVELS